MPNAFQFIITDFVKDDLAPERELLGDLGEIIALDGHHEDDLIGRVEKADAIMLYHELRLSAKTIDRLTNCKLIVRCGVGYDNVDWKRARDRGITVANVPDYGTEEVADSAIAMTLSLTRGVSLYNTLLQREPSANWTYQHAAPLHRLRGKVFGVMGVGRIGSATALRAKALGFDVIFYDPYTRDGMDKALGIRRVEKLEDFLHQSHILSVHCPATPETTGLIDHDKIMMMKKGSYLVNTARGVVVDPNGVLKAIESGHLAGAALDVLPEEPPSLEDPIIKAWRDPNHPASTKVIINPHAAFYSVEGFLDMRTKGSIACRRAVLGEPIPNIVN
jgi:C-terminal binding protein